MTFNMTIIFDSYEILIGRITIRPEKSYYKYKLITKIRIYNEYKR
jgi:hypothetical protein